VRIVILYDPGAEDWTPEDVAANPASFTGHYLQALLVA